VIRLLCGLLAILVTPLTYAASADTGSRNWSIAPREAWVQSPPATAAQAIPTTGMLLHDRQIRITGDGDERYEHTVLRVSGAQLIDDTTQVDVPVDPRFQQLVIHALRLTHAGGPAQDFTPAQIREQLQTQPREAEPRKRELNPQLRISIQVPDAHAGDILEFEYTVQSHAAGMPGAFAGHYAAQWSSDGDEPVRWERLHVSWPVERAMQYRLTGGPHSSAPQIVTHPGELDLQWRNLAPPASEPDTPRWFERTGAVQLSDFADWSQVAAFLAPQYGRPVRDPDQPPEALDQPTSRAAPGLILNALRLVQAKVQTTNVVGDGPYVPADPAIVLQRGYGDSRDLARLLVSLLRRVAIDAQVSLANSRGVLLDNTLPSPFMLDSAIVVARAGGIDYWLNPAAPGPAAALGTTDPADLRRVLLISATGGKLVVLPRPAPDSRLHAVTQQFDLRHGNTQPATLTLTTQFRGSWAQAVRAQLLAQSPAQLQLTQIQSVAQDYPNATADGEVQLQDLPDRQLVQLSARFRIPQPLGDNRDPQFGFFAEALTDSVQPRDEATRRYPLDLPWPLQLEEHIFAALPPDLVAPEGRIVIETEAFRYVRNVRFDHGTLHIDHSYVALADHIAAADYPKFLQANAQVYQALGVHVQAQGLSWHRGLTWLGQHSFALAGLAAAIVIAAAGWLRLRR
jgi:hypothetical protein